MSFRQVLLIPVFLTLLYACLLGMLFLIGTIGYIPAQAWLGNLFYHGWGVPSDHETAVYWYREASERGSPEGDYLLATMYLNGEGVEADFREALLLYQRAADSGLGVAQVTLGEIVASVDGVSSKATAEAYKYLVLATENGESTAYELLSKLRDRMTATQIMEGDRLLQEFKEKNPPNAGK